jgi:hypothetical protein
MIPFVSEVICGRHAVRIESVDLIEMKAQQEAMVLHHPAADAFTRRSARLASLAGSVSPAISASSMARPVLPIKSISTESNLMLASSSVFCNRST